MAAQKKKKLSLINLLPQDDFESSTFGRIFKWVLSSFRAIVIVVEIVVIGGFASRFWLDTRNSNLDDDIKNRANIIAADSTFEQEFRSTQKKLNVYSEISKDDDDVLPVVKQITSRLPADTQLTGLSVNGFNVEIKGASPAEESISQYIANLAGADIFTDILLTNIESNSDNPLISFTLKTSIAGLAPVETEDGNGG